MKTSITIQELKRRLAEGQPLLLLDVRTLEEYDRQHIPMAANLPVEVIESGSFVPEPRMILVTVCGKGGGRSERAADHLRHHFQNEVYFLEGGTIQWMEKGSD